MYLRTSLWERGILLSLWRVGFHGLPVSGGRLQASLGPLLGDEAQKPAVSSQNQWAFGGLLTSDYFFRDTTHASFRGPFITSDKRLDFLLLSLIKCPEDRFFSAILLEAKGDPPGDSRTMIRRGISSGTTRVSANASPRLRSYFRCERSPQT